MSIKFRHFSLSWGGDKVCQYHVHSTWLWEIQLAVVTLYTQIPVARQNNVSNVVVLAGYEIRNLHVNGCWKTCYKRLWTMHCISGERNCQASFAWPSLAIYAVWEEVFQSRCTSAMEFGSFIQKGLYMIDLFYKQDGQNEDECTPYGVCIRHEWSSVVLKNPRKCTYSISTFVKSNLRMTRYQWWVEN
jgi:hypothetical protein